MQWRLNSVAIPPPSIILILVLGGIDVALTALAVVFGLSGFWETDPAAAWIGWFFGVAAIFATVHLILKIVSLIGLYLARRWAVVVGALAFSVSWPLVLVLPTLNGGWMPSLIGVAVLMIAFFLACTLPHWKRMT
ncbi:MAG: hypothetical protein NT015_05530 [Alphaproteobacteria bacterium]|nr:hypothetical protein [Alphaproteobacteria bacterium]